MKKSTVFAMASTFIFILSLLIFYPDPVKAAAQTATVNVDTLNVREKATVTSTKLGSLKKGTAVTVYSTANVWSRIQYKTKKAYVSSKHLTLTSSASGQLKSIKTYAAKGMIDVTQKIKVGDKASLIQKTFGKPQSSWGMREYYVLEYPKFSALYFGKSDGSGEYPIIEPNTKIYNLSTTLNKGKGYTLKQIKEVFGNNFERSYSPMSGEYSIIYYDLFYYIYEPIIGSKNKSPQYIINSILNNKYIDKFEIENHISKSIRKQMLIIYMCEFIYSYVFTLDTSLDDNCILKSIEILNILLN